MKLSFTLKIATILISLCGAASAASSIVAQCEADVDFTTDPTSLSNELSSAFTAKVGWYDGAPLTTGSQYTDINAHWTAVGSVAFATGTMTGYNGYFDTRGISYPDSLGLAGKNVWLWVTNGSNQNLLMEATSVVAGFGYKFHSASDLPNAGSVEVKAAFEAGWTLFLGTFTPTGANAAYGGSYVLNLPETSTTLLGALGALTLLRRRRA